MIGALILAFAVAMTLATVGYVLYLLSIRTSKGKAILVAKITNAINTTLILQHISNQYNIMCVQVVSNDIAKHLHTGEIYDVLVRVYESVDGSNYIGSAVLCDIHLHDNDCS